jgi:hypothetical protein
VSRTYCEIVSKLWGRRESKKRRTPKRDAATMMM